MKLLLLPPPQHPPLAFTINEAIDVSRIGRTKIYEAIANGSLRAKKFGNKTLILREDLQDWLKSLPSFTPSYSSNLRNRRRALVAAD
jgi:excisionase family DNA binding protein